VDESIRLHSNRTSLGLGTRFHRLRRQLGVNRSLLPVFINRQLDRSRREAHRVDGLPGGLTRELVSDVVARRRNAGVVGCSYVTLGSWKLSEVSHVRIELDDGTSKDVVFKDSRYGPSEYPAIVGFNHPVGQPEYSVYGTCDGDLLDFVPQVMTVEEVKPNVHYRYLLEDLTRRFHPVYGSGDKRRLLKIMPELHRALAAWESGKDVRMLRYDEELVADLLDHARGGLEELEREAGTGIAEEVLAVWPLTVRFLLDEKNLARRRLRPIHGDFNTGNAFSARGRGARLIDWEWTGLGMPHDDVASLLKRRNSGLERVAMETLRIQDPSLSMEDHRELLAWSRLFTVLRDASLLSHQYLGLDRPPVSELRDETGI
jgi:hypothetical protein